MTTGQRRLGRGDVERCVVCASAGARRLGAHRPAVAPAYHRWHFSPVTRRALLAGCGLRMVRHHTVFSRHYWRPLPRLVHARQLLVADAAACRSLGVRHPWPGDLLRVFARRDGAPAESGAARDGAVRGAVEVAR